MEKATHAAENPADVKAAEKMARLFDEIKKDNPDNSPEFVHNLNIFFSRLLFCYFSEDTNIFEDQQFTYAIQSHTQSDGSDLDAYLNRLFGVLNTPVQKRGDIPQYLNAFPYVNGGLFREEIPCPKFTSKSRQLLIDSGDNNDWSAINPDIFGSMFQAVISPEHRGGLGAHYTSVPNIMKVIEPLFLNELKEAFDEALGNEKKLKELQQRISKIKLFDPACGSGNFLIIAYKELRKLEIQILKEISGLKGRKGTGTLQLGNELISNIHLNNFYGIELDDFAHEIAKLSLWLTEHQMNVEFFNEFGSTNPTLPLQEAGQIVCGNACRLDWEKVCQKNEGDEIYIMGNPPYIGSRYQTIEHKTDMSYCIGHIQRYKKLDYVSCWFSQAKNFISNAMTISMAFVSTNSINQGEQAKILFNHILNDGLFIHFAFLPFSWINNAKNKAAVDVVIIGMTRVQNRPKRIYNGKSFKNVSHINEYLSSSNVSSVAKRSKSISNLPDITKGCYPTDGEGLLLKEEEYMSASKYEELKPYLKPFVGTTELLHDKKRWCVYLNEFDYEKVKHIEYVKSRIEIVTSSRLSSTKSNTRKLASTPFKFEYDSSKFKSGFIIPCISSQRRKYLPVGTITADTVVYGTCQVIYSNDPKVLSLLSSHLHILWVSLTCGRMKSDFNYSSSLCYNTFPFPSVSNQHIEELTQCTFRILEEREKHPEKTLAQLYDPDKMPEGLKEAHRLNDEAVERCYRSTPFNSDEERLEYLFKLYEKMIQEEKEKGTLFETEKKTRKKK
jgi:type I restriction-modification system DNA methylase subunit